MTSTLFVLLYLRPIFPSPGWARQGLFINFSNKFMSNIMCDFVVVQYNKFLIKLLLVPNGMKKV